MPPSHPSPSVANRGLSSRQWKDISRAMKEIVPGVTIVLHGVKISGDNRPAGNHQQQQQQQPRNPQQSPPPPRQNVAEQDADQNEPMETVDSPPAGSSKRKQKDARKLEEFLERKRAERWLPLVRPLLHTLRRKLRDATWTAWMRERTASKRLLRLKLKDLFWRGWTYRNMSAMTADPVLGFQSLRDNYIRGYVYDLCAEHLPEAYEKLKPFHQGGSLYPFDLEGRDGEDVTTDMLRRLLAAAVEWEKTQSPTRNSSARKVGKSTSEEAEVVTPSSARRSHKKRGGRR